MLLQTLALQFRASDPKTRLHHEPNTVVEKLDRIVYTQNGRSSNG